MKTKPTSVVAAAIVLQNSGRIIGPYFLGKSMKAIEERYKEKISNLNFDIQEIGIERVTKLRGYTAALNKIREEKDSACLIAE